MEKWKAPTAFHFPTPPTAAATELQSKPLRYTDNQTGAKDRADQTRLSSVRCYSIIPLTRRIVWTCDGQQDLSGILVVSRATLPQSARGRVADRSSRTQLNLGLLSDAALFTAVRSASFSRAASPGCVCRSRHESRCKKLERTAAAPRLPTA